MSTLRGAGLGIDLSSAETDPASQTYSSITVAPSLSMDKNVLLLDDLQADSQTQFESNSIAATAPRESHRDIAALGHRSTRGMHGLLLAETGASMVEIDPHGMDSGFKEGQRIAPQYVTPGGGSRTQRRRHLSVDETRLNRQGTLLSVSAPPTRNAAELKSLLGNSNMKLKSRAKVSLPPSPVQATKLAGAGGDIQVPLEQAKSRARLEVDIVLDNNVCVQGGFLKGHIHIRVREQSKKEAPIKLADGKIRVVGFECISNEVNRHVFYQCMAPWASITSSYRNLYVSEQDMDGFAQAREGVHILPFGMELPIEGAYGNAKGVIAVHSGVTVRYIAMVSVKVKDSESGKRSIAHFYRSCEIWPRLDPSVILAPVARPIQSTVTAPLFMGGSGRIKLTAFLHRLYWISGQRCYLKVAVENDTKKTVKSVSLSLIRTTTIFKPSPALDTHPRSADPDACQTSTSRKEVAHCTLEMGQRSAKGHASAKGWWTGVGPGEEAEFYHFIQLPPDTLSVTRGRLLEVEYTIRVTASAGSLTSDVHVVVPIRIVNFLSIDPPPSSPLLFETSNNDRLLDPGGMHREVEPCVGEGKTRMCNASSQSFIETLSVSAGETAIHPPSQAATILNVSPHAHADPADAMRLTNPHSMASSRCNSEDERTPAHGSMGADNSLAERFTPSNVEAQLCSVSLSQEGGNSDEQLVDFVVGSARLDDDVDPWFSEQSYMHRSGEVTPKSAASTRERDYGPLYKDGPSLSHSSNMGIQREPLGTRTRSKTVSDIHKVPSTARPCFATRVQEKLAAIAAAQSQVTEDKARPSEEDFEPEPRSRCPSVFVMPSREEEAKSPEGSSFSEKEEVPAVQSGSFCLPDIQAPNSLEVPMPDNASQVSSYTPMPFENSGREPAAPTLRDTTGIACDRLYTAKHQSKPDVDSLFHPGSVIPSHVSHPTLASSRNISAGLQHDLSRQRAISNAGVGPAGVSSVRARIAELERRAKEQM